jgi:arsenical pump membrane protein
LLANAILLALLVGTVAGLYRPPFGLRDWHVAAAGGLAAWVTGPLWFRSGAEYVLDQWGILAFFLGLMLIAAAAEASGLYALAASALGHAGRHIAIVTLSAGIAITAVLSNDATPLILTPAVLAVTLRRDRDPTTSTFAITFAADGASMLLPFSNPVALLFVERFHISLVDYISLYTLPALAGALVLGILGLRGRTKVFVAPVAHRQAATPVGSAGYRAFVVLILVALLAAYVVSEALGFPLGAATLAAGLAVFAGALLAKGDLSVFRARVTPGVLVLIAGLLLLVESATAQGLLDGVGDALAHLAEQPAWLTIGGVALLAAFVSNVMNNWPAALLVSSAILATPGANEELIAGALIGCAIGANATAYGSLSTVFWMALLRNGGVQVSPTAYFKRAWFPTLAGMLAACAVAVLTVA